MTNGYPLAAIIGRKEIMDAAQGTFISSTFYTERVALAATCKTIEVYQRERVWEKQIEYGQQVKKGWSRLANKHNLHISVGGMDPLAHFRFDYDNPLEYKTFFTQEMLRQGFLASNAFYASYAHSPQIISEYLEAVDKTFCIIEQIVEKGERIEDYLQGPTCHAGFERLN
jgi:glutamate-1-semialdehyde aminotransferase